MLIFTKKQILDFLDTIGKQEWTPIEKETLSLLEIDDYFHEEFGFRRSKKLFG